MVNSGVRLNLKDKEVLEDKLGGKGRVGNELAQHFYIKMNGYEIAP